MCIRDRHCNAEGMLFMGRQMNYPVALEGALKMKEISYIYALSLIHILNRRSQTARCVW